MLKIRRILNQNYVAVIIGIIIVIIALAIIQVLNNFSKEERKRENEKVTKTMQENYTQESQSIISDERIASYKKQDVNTTIDNFMKYCFAGEYDKAYSLISDECKKEMYPSEESFERSYCENRFTKNQKYNFQFYANTVLGDIYLVKVFDNILATGTATASSSIQDYITVVKQEDTYRLNLDNYIGKRYFTIQKKKENIKITAKNSKIYMDYEIYHIKVENDSNRTILLDSKRKTDSVFAIDNNGAKCPALIYENADEDLIIPANTSKEFDIKFSNTFQSRADIVQVKFTDIIKNYNDYLKDTKNYKDVLSIQMER